MEIQLQELIEQIKKDGVETAEAKASEIINSANEEAERIIIQAKEQAEKMIADAKEENERYIKVSEDAIIQAGRNVLISFRDSVNKELDVIIGNKVSELYSSEGIIDVITKVIYQLSDSNQGDDINILLNSADETKLRDGLLSELKNKCINGVTLTPNDDFNGGFRVAVSNGTAYYDYSSEAVTQMLSVYLNPKVTKLLKEAK